MPWPQPYQIIGRNDLAEKYQRRRITRNATITAGAVLAAAGVGVLFVGGINQINCANDTSGCGRPELIVGGLSALGVGAIAITTGLILRKHPVPVTEIESLVEDHNADLR